MNADPFYPPIEPYRTGRLKVSDLHTIYFEESGNLNGKPAVYIHGGPGWGSSPFQRRFHNPEKYRIILFDQRGCGKSSPAESLDENTTWDLVSDMEKLREHLEIKSWQVCGGSWGSTLGLAYAITHPSRVSELILRGIFLVTQEELDWFYGGKGANYIFPDHWEDFVSLIPEDERSDMIRAYFRRITSSDQKTRVEAAIRWSVWEAATLSLLPSPDVVKSQSEVDQAMKVAKIECHYFMNRAFFKGENFLLENLSQIQKIPTTIIHGRYDVICPAKFAWKLHKALPKASLQLIPDAGHAATEPGIARAIVAATDVYSLTPK